MTKVNKPIKKSQSKELGKPLTKSEVKKRLSKANYYDEHPDHIYDKLSQMLMVQDVSDWTDEEREYVHKHVKSVDNFTKSHVGLAETQWEWNLRTTVIELTNNLIEEYECNNTLEQTLCEVIANSYGKVMQISRKFTSVMIAGEYLSDERTRYLSMLWKELDRANRSYLTALNNLIELKRPQMNINVKTKNAYFWQNQQFNHNDTPHENIKD